MNTPKMSNTINPYGDGFTCVWIADILSESMVRILNLT